MSHIIANDKWDSTLLSCRHVECKRHCYCFNWFLLLSYEKIHYTDNPDQFNSRVILITWQIIRSLRYSCQDIQYSCQNIQYSCQDIQYICQDIQYICQDIHRICQDIHRVCQDILSRSPVCQDIFIVFVKIYSSYLSRCICQDMWWISISLVI